MFHFTGCCDLDPMYSGQDGQVLILARLPHSEICGSKCICHYPQLIAAYHVLLRLSAPRHPSCALCSLINLMPSTGPKSASANSITETRSALDTVRRSITAPPTVRADLFFRLSSRSCTYYPVCRYQRTGRRSNRQPNRGPSSPFGDESAHVKWEFTSRINLLPVKPRGPDRTRTYDPALIKRML